MITFNSRGLGPAALAITSVVALGACGTGSNSAGAGGGSGSITAGPGVDVSSKTISIGILDALSGPAAALGKPALAGAQAFWDATNANGGIDGWKVNLVVRDEAYNPTQHVQEYQAVKDHVAVLDSFGSPTTKAIQAQLDQSKLMTAPLSFDSAWGRDPVMAPVGTPYAFDVANALDYVTSAGAKKLKVGIIYQNDEYGADALRGFDAALSADGFQDAGRQPFNLTDKDFTAQVQKLKSAGADVVVLTAIPSASGPIVGTAATLGFHPQWILQGPSFIERLITTDGSAQGKPTPIAPALSGALVTMFSSTWGNPSAAGMQQMLTDHDKYAADQAPSIYFTLAYAQAKMEAAVLKKAIESKDLSRQGIVNAKVNAGSIDLGGLAPSVNYSAQLGPPSRGSLIEVIDTTATGFLKPVQTNYLSKVANSLTV